VAWVVSEKALPHDRHLSLVWDWIIQVKHDRGQILFFSSSCPSLRLSFLIVIFIFQLVYDATGVVDLSGFASTSQISKLPHDGQQFT